MQFLGKKGGFVLLWAWFFAAIGCGQHLIKLDTMIIFKMAGSPDSAISLVKFRLAQKIEYSVFCSGLLFLNWQQGDKNNLISVLHHLKYDVKVTNDRNLTICNSFIQDLGIQFFLDSISRFQPDNNTMDNRVELRISKKLEFTVFSNITTRLFNSYIYTTDQTRSLLKTRGASFLTPLLWTFSTGLAWPMPQFGTISVGISAAKLTLIRDREVYDQQHILVYYGVPKEKNYILEYGLSLHLLVDKYFLKRVHWYCDLLIFKNYEKPVDLVMKNLIGIRINNLFKTSIQTRLYYEKEVSKNIQIENLLSIGFYFNL